MNNTEFSRVRRDASRVYDVAEVQHLVSEELALGVLEFETCDAKTLEDCFEVAQMLEVVARVDNHVVKVRETDARHQSSKHDRHESLVGGRCIAQAERHLGHLEEAGV